MRRIGVTAAVAAVVTAVVAGGAAYRLSAGHGAPADGEAARPSTTVSFNRSVCAPEWTHPQGGTQRFVVDNTSIAGGEVYLENATTGAVYADFETIGAGAELAQTVTLGDGTYRFVCLPAETDAIQGAVETVSGSHVTVGLTPGIVPVTSNDLDPIATRYHDWVITQLPGLLTDSGILDTEVATGNLVAARADWLAAHLDYERLGAAYDAFGDADAAIDGTPAGLRGGTGDPDFTGLHRIELLLWGGGGAASVRVYTTRLVSDVQGLINDFSSAEIDPLAIGLRAHEIAENALQFEATGRTDEGSGTNLATIDANLAGTRTVLSFLTGLLATRFTGMPEVTRWLDRTQQLVDSQRPADGLWTPVEKLDQTTRERLNADLSELTEQLAPIAAICDIRRPAQ
jgi:iron uptake system component EfeO